jgi:hypothetical protein
VATHAFRVQTLTGNGPRERGRQDHRRQQPSTPGNNGVGTLNVGALTLSPGAVYNYEFNPSAMT